MADRYENIRKALEAIQASARGHRHKRDLAHLDFREACDPDTIRALLTERDTLERDAERYRWLRMMAKEQLLNPKAAGSERPDMRTYWRIPTLICSGPVGGFIDFDAAIDQARGKGVADA